jgi:DNA-binding GntR family transcriptional regulator
VYDGDVSKACIRIQHMNSQDKAYNYLKNAIISLELRPGNAVRTEEISQKLKVSRTPVREALSRLEQDGFVIRERGWGYIVRPISHKEILDVFAVREVLEVLAAMAAQPRLKERDHQRLAAIIAEA